MLLGWALPLTLRNVNLFEAVAAFLALFSAGVSLAHGHPPCRRARLA
jgi:hypothetical protein